MQFAGQLLTLGCVREESYVSILGLILTGFANERALHKLEELLLDLGLGGGTEISILRDVGFQRARLF